MERPTTAAYSQKAEKVDAEHMGANLLPCNAAARLQARASLFGFLSEKTCGGFMAQIIEFYVPDSFRKTATKWIPPERRGKVIPFDLLRKKSV